MKQKYALKTYSLSKKYGNRTIIDNITMKVEEGIIYGLIGGNGAGKTTFMRLILGLIQANGGRIEIFESNNLYEARKVTGCLIERTSFYPDLTALKNMQIQSAALGLNNKSECIDLLIKVRLEQAVEMKVGHFSLGMKQRLGIAMALLGDPKFLILDEPINGLDPIGIKLIRDLLIDLKKSGKTILISSHIIEELSKVADRYGIMKNGKIIKEINKEEILNEKEFESLCIKMIGE